MCRPSKCQKAQMSNKMKNWGSRNWKEPINAAPGRLGSFWLCHPLPLWQMGGGQVACLYLISKKGGSIRWLQRAPPVLTHYDFVFRVPVQWHNFRFLSIRLCFFLIKKKTAAILYMIHCKEKEEMFKGKFAEGITTLKCTASFLA